MPSECLQIDRLAQIAKDRAQEYAAAAPFPHTVIDGFLTDDVLAQVIGEIPAHEAPLLWTRLEGNAPDRILAQKGKQHIEDERRFGQTTRHLLRELRSAAFLEVLHELTGIRPLLPDPYNVGGGLHMCEPGAMLRIHADFKRHPMLLLERRLNLIFYLNEDWDESFGGDLELWAGDMSTCVRRIAPVANRCVVFTTSRSSFHGHPQPLRCPPGRTRTSITHYYYTNTPWDPHVHEDLETRWRTPPPH